MGWIYAFRDDRYDAGVKIGWDGGSSGYDRWGRAHCYTPETIKYLAAWRIEEIGKGRKTAELWECRASRGLARLANDYGGCEWYDVSGENAIAAISKNLGVASQSMPDRVMAEWDDFRHPKSTGAKDFALYRQVVWIYVEGFTGRIKVQRTSKWKTPLQQTMTYSRNGFWPLHAMTYSEPCSASANSRLVEALNKVVDDYASPSGRTAYGWLRSGTTAAEIVGRFESLGLSRVPESQLTVSTPLADVDNGHG